MWLYTTLPRLSRWLGFNRTLRFTKIVATISARFARQRIIQY